MLGERGEPPLQVLESIREQAADVREVLDDLDDGALCGFGIDRIKLTNELLGYEAQLVFAVPADYLFATFQGGNI